MARGDGKDIVLDDPAIKLDGHLSAFAARVAVEHPTAAAGHARGAYVSVPTRPGTSDNLADLFTKVLDRVPFEKLRGLTMNLLACAVRFLGPRAKRGRADG